MLPPNLHEYMEEVGTAIWKIFREGGQDCIVHEMHMLFAGGTSARNIIALIARLLAPRNSANKGLFRSLHVLTCDSQSRSP
jgi:hypothetical protein